MWPEKLFNELSREEFYDILHLRIQTFIIEQERIYEELDHYDKQACHIFYRDVDSQEIVAYARVFRKQDVITFGRVVTAKQKRGSGLGRALTEQIVAYCKKEFLYESIKIEAQEQVVNFYKKFGFVTKGLMFLFEGTPHVEMEMQL